MCVCWSYKQIKDITIFQFEVICAVHFFEWEITVFWCDCIIIFQLIPVWVSTQWPELFESGRVLSWKTVEGLTIVEWDIASIVWLRYSCIESCVHVSRGDSCRTLWCDESHLGICETPMGPASTFSTTWSICRTVAAMALQISIPDAIGIATTSTMVRIIVRICQFAYRWRATR